MTTLLLTSCAGTASKQPAIAATQRVDQPADCERILQEYPVVQIAKGADFRALFYRAQDGQVIENSTIRKGRECIAKQRELYGTVK